MSKFFRSQADFITAVRDNFRFDVTPLINRLARDAGPWGDRIEPIGLVGHALGKVPGLPLGYGRKPPRVADRDAALGVVVAELFQDLEGIEGLWASAHRLVATFRDASESSKEDYERVDEWSLASHRAIEEFRRCGAGANLNDDQVRAVALVRDLLDVLDDLRDVMADVETLPQLRGVKPTSHGPGRPGLDELIRAEDYLKKSGFSYKEIDELMPYRKGGDPGVPVEQLTAKQAADRISSRVRAYRSRTKRGRS